MRAFLLLFAGSIGCLLLGMNLRADEPFGLQPPVPGQPIPAGPPSIFENPVPLNPRTPQPVPMPVAQPDPNAALPLPGFNPPTEAQRIEERRQAEAAEAKAGPKFPAPGDDELRKLQIARYNAAFGEAKCVNAAYSNGTVSFDLLFEAQKHLLQAELDLSDKPADQIAAYEHFLEAAKQQEAKVKSLYDSQTRGGEADKYFQAKFHRLDAEIQLLRAKRKAGLAK